MRMNSFVAPTSDFSDVKCLEENNYSSNENERKTKEETLLNITSSHA